MSDDLKRLARGKAMHDAMTDVPEAWDAIGDDGREDWCLTAALPPSAQADFTEVDTEGKS